MIEATGADAVFGAIHVTAVRSAAAILAEAFVRHGTELRLAEQLRTDHVTGLGTRWAFDETLADVARRVARHASPGFALALLDLDRFSLVNDALGPRGGRSAARRCRRPAGRRRRARARRSPGSGATSSWSSTTARRRSPAPSPAPRTCSTGSGRRSRSASRPVTLTASVGLVHAVDSSADAVELLRRADLALRRAKDHGGDTIEVDDEHLRATGRVRACTARPSCARRSPATASRSTTRASGTCVTGELVAVGGPRPLACTRARGCSRPAPSSRWPRSPGSSTTSGQRVLREACAALGSWRDRGHGAGPRCMRVNVSARQLRNDDLAQQVSDALADSGIPPSALCLELTESALLIDPAGSLARLERLRELGVGLAVDDFGTGYSSLLYLKRLPVTAVKIDRAFVKDLPEPAQRPRHRPGGGPARRGARDHLHRRGGRDRRAA